MMKERFWRWYRTIPIVCMLLACVLSAASNLLPSKVIRTVFYPVKYADVIEQASQRYGVDEYLICAVIKCESNWDASATSNAGAVGLMQLMPSTSEAVAKMGSVDSSTYSPDNLTDPTTNIMYGTAYLAYLQKNLSTRDQVIAAYNAGLGSVSKWLANGSDISQHIQYSETASYLVRVNQAYERYKQFYPSGISESQ